MPTQTDRLNAGLAGRYLVERELGAGGMATVYLAQDLKHEREVAIKVLHPDLGAALGAERFLAEIKTTAKLQHPHILPLLDSGAVDADRSEGGPGLLFYVMPLVEGETLRARLSRERQLPIDTSLRIATEAAGALDYAHRHGVIHRDIKPENILLHDGRAVIADFGIALAVSAASGSRMTQTGLSLGTPQYMAPEQAMGEKQIDARADIYALGAVLYEMLTGEPPFSGATVQAIVAKVLTEKPMHPTAVRDTIPPHVETTVLKALAKLPADRFATAAEFADALARPEATAGVRATAAGAARTASEEAHAAGRRFTAAPVAWAVAAVAIAVGLMGWLRDGAPHVPSRPVIRAVVPAVAGTTPTIIGGGGLFGISDDGSRVAFTGVDSTNIARIFVQSLDAPVVTAVPSSDFATGAFFAPDGKSIGFFRNGRLFTVAVPGGTPTNLAPAVQPRGAVWGADGSIVYSNGGNLSLVPATGGTPVSLAERPDANTAYRNPAFAGSRRIIFDVVVDNAPPTLATLSLGDKKVTRLGIAGLKPAYVDPGVLAWVSMDASLWAVEFDASRGRVSGTPRLVTGGVSLGGLNNPRLAIAPNGTTLLMAGTGADDRELVIVDRTGRPAVVGPGKRPYRYPRFSPDGRRLAFGLMGVRGPGSGDVWTLDLEAGTMLRITSDSVSYHPEWDPDGKSVISVKRPVSGVTGLYRTSVDGTSPASLVAEGPAGIWEASITPDRKTIVFRMDGTTTMRDIYTVPADSPKAVLPLVKTNFDEYGPSVAPDGKWLAYASNEAGTTEVYVRRLEPSSPRWRVSRSGGFEPRWAKTGELFFRNRDSVFVSRIVPGPEPRIGAPEVVFGGRYDASNFEPLWDVSPDARRFAMVRTVGGSSTQIHVLLNWLDRWRATKP